MESYLEDQLQSRVSTMDDNTQSRMLSDKFMAELCDQIPTDWEKLGIELEVHLEKMRELRDKCTTDVSRWAKEMLFKWTEYFEGNISLVELCEGLEKVGRNDLVQVVRETFPGVSELPSCTQELQVLFQKLADKLSIEWYNLGIQLDVPSEDLDAIKIDTEPAKDLNPAFEMLKFWNKEFIGPSRLDLLKRSLRECRRNDIVRWIEEKQDQTNYVFARQRSTKKSETQDLPCSFQSMQVSDEHTSRYCADSTDQCYRYAETVSCQQHTCTTPSSYNSDIPNQRAVPREGYDEIDNNGRTPGEHDENAESGCFSTTSSELTQSTLVRLDSLSDNGNKDIDIPGGLNDRISKVLTGKTSADSIRGEYSVCAASTTSC